MTNPERGIFFFNERTREGIDSAQPKEMTLAEARSNLNCIASDGGFLGIVLSSQAVAQISCSNEGDMEIELLNRSRMTTESASVNLPIAIQALGILFETSDLEDLKKNLATRFFFLQWHEDKLR